MSKTENIARLTDVFGNLLEVGDHAACGGFEYGLTEGVVVGFTPTRVRVRLPRPYDKARTYIGTKSLAT